MLPAYAELHCISNFSFLRGASHPEELIDRARELGYAALALTDECSLAGVVRAHLQAQLHDFPLLIGAEFSLQHYLPAMPWQVAPRDRVSERKGEFPPTAKLVLLARNRNGYGRLSELITTARGRAVKGQYQLLDSDLEDGVPDCTALLLPAQGPLEAHPAVGALARSIRDRFGERAWLGVELLARGHDNTRLEQLRALGRTSGLPLVAAGDVQFHRRSRKPLHDTLTAIRLGTPITQCGLALAPNAEQHLRSRLRLASLYPAELLEQIGRAHV